MEEIQKSIEALNLKFSDIVFKGDGKALGELYTEDACIMPTNSISIYGRKNIQDYWVRVISGLGLNKAHLRTIEVIGEDDMVVERGEYQLTKRGMEEGILDAGKYVVIWKNTPEGWKIHWDIWNTSMANP